MLSPSKPQILFVGSSGIPKNPYPAFESINLSLNHSATSLAIFAPLVLPQENVLVVSKKLPPKKHGGFDLGLTKPEDIVNSHTGGGNSNESLDGKGEKDAKLSAENLFSHPIKVLFNHK